MKTFNPLSLKLLKTLTPLVLVFFVGSISAAEGGPCKDYGDCDEFKYSLNDTESLQRGAAVFLNYCYGCHSLQYSRWGRVAKDLNIPEELFAENLIFDSSIKMGDLMKGSMSKDASAEWFGVAPPDLTLVTRSKGDDWVYTYLRAYYEDSSKQYGVNNLVYPGTAMPNVLIELQGNQKLVCKNTPVIGKNGGEKRDDS
ncbi:cytochrome c1, partial [Gammaproteobacteria bacterium]|nr:cytochrome c1 [Gammaproteobacteria bacterium]